VSCLEGEGVTRWRAFAALSARPLARSKKVVFPYGADKRRLLPDAPGVYRMLRSNRDVLYVGKAASIAP
jgi:hypothetical protein